MSKDDKILYGKNGPGDLETIISEIELETAEARHRLSKLKGEEYDPFEGHLWRHRTIQAEATLKEIIPKPRRPRPAAEPAQPDKGDAEPDEIEDPAGSKETKRKG